MDRSHAPRRLIALLGSAAVASAPVTAGEPPAADAAARVAHDAEAPAQTIVHRAEGLFGPIFVVDEGPHRYLRFDAPDGDDQTAVLRSEPAALPMPYLRAMLLGLAPFEHDPRNVLLVGVGGGGFINAVAPRFARTAVHGVEIDPAVLKVAKAYFGLRETERVKLFVDDGGRFIRRAQQRYDVIALDAYDADTVPAHLATPAFFASVRARLSDRGVVVMNLGMNSERELNALVETAADALGGDCLMVKAYEDDNLVLVIKPSGALNRASLTTAAARLDARLDFGFSLSALAKTAKRCPVP